MVRVLSPQGDTEFERAPRGLDRTAQNRQCMSLEWMDADGVACTYRGVFDQRGKVGLFQATYACTNAEEGNAAIAPLRIVEGTITGRLRAHGVNDGCDHAASFATASGVPGVAGGCRVAPWNNGALTNHLLPCP